jgi:hypothetical protein
MDFFKAIGSGVILIVVVYCDLIGTAMSRFRRVLAAIAYK